MRICVKASDEMIEIMKSFGVKDYSRLRKVPIVDKNGHTRMVYKRTDVKPVVENKKRTDNDDMETSPFKTEEEKKQFGIALYTLNKEAKRIRDIKKDLYDYNHGGYGTKEIADLAGLDFDDEEICGFTSEEKKLKSEQDAADYASDCWEKMYEAKERMDQYGDEDSDDYDEDEYDDAEYDKDFYEREYESAKKIESKFEKLNTVNIKSTDEGFVLAGKQNDIMDSLRDQQEIIYDIKNKVLTKLKPKVIAYHEFEKGDIRPLYQIGDFKFHGIEVDNVPEGAKVEKLSTISAENKLSDSDKISFDQAIKTVKKYL